MRIPVLSDIIIFVNENGDIELKDFEDMSTIPDSAQQFDELIYKAITDRLVQREEIKDLADRTQPFLKLVS